MDKNIYRPSEDVISSQVGDELVLLHTATDKAYGLDATSAFVWALLDADGKTREQLVDDLTGHFDVEFDRALADLDALLKHFSRENLICSEPMKPDFTG